MIGSNPKKSKEINLSYKLIIIDWSQWKQKDAQARVRYFSHILISIFPNNLCISFQIVFEDFLILYTQLSLRREIVNRNGSISFSIRLCSFFFHLPFNSFYALNKAIEWLCSFSETKFSDIWFCCWNGHNS